MKTKSSIRKLCLACKIIKRHKRCIVICTNLKHKQRQG